MDNIVKSNNGIITPSEKKIIEDLCKDDSVQEFIRELKMFNLKYVAAMKETETKISILNEDFKIRYNQNKLFINHHA